MRSQAAMPAPVAAPGPGIMQITQSSAQPLIGHSDTKPLIGLSDTLWSLIG